MPTELPTLTIDEAIGSLDTAAFDLHGAHAPNESWMLCQDWLCVRRRAALAILLAALLPDERQVRLRRDEANEPLRWGSGDPVQFDGLRTVLRAFRMGHDAKVYTPRCLCPTCDTAEAYLAALDVAQGPPQFTLPPTDTEGSE